MRMTVTLDSDEIKALSKLAEREKRHTRQQAAVLIRQQLEKLGLLQSTHTTEEAANARQAA